MDEAGNGEGGSAKTLYERLGGYDKIVAIAGEILPGARADKVLSRFWLYRGSDGIKREVQYMVDFFCERTGGPRGYTGRDLAQIHHGMNVTEEDWSRLLTILHATLKKHGVSRTDAQEFVTLVQSHKRHIVGL